MGEKKIFPFMYLTFGYVSLTWWRLIKSVSQSVSQYVLVSSTLVGLATRYYFLSECWCLKFAVLFLLGALSDERAGLQFAVKSLNGSGRAEPVTILYCLIWDSPRPRFPYLYPPGTGWPSYTLLFPLLCRKIALLFVLGRTPRREVGSVICSELSSSCDR
jgi:hypothetical protein